MICNFTLLDAALLELATKKWKFLLLIIITTKLFVIIISSTIYLNQNVILLLIIITYMLLVNIINHMNKNNHFVKSAPNRHFKVLTC